MTSRNPTLTIVTKYGIETYWDFGFVQVSTDNGATWTSLSNATQLLTITGSSPSNPHNFQDSRRLQPIDWPSFMTMSFDLSAYVGKTVQIRFRYMTDGYKLRRLVDKSATVSGTAMTLELVPYESNLPSDSNSNDSSVWKDVLTV